MTESPPGPRIIFDPFFKMKVTKRGVELRGRTGEPFLRSTGATPKEAIRNLKAFLDAMENPPPLTPVDTVSTPPEPT